MLGNNKNWLCRLVKKNYWPKTSIKKINFMIYLFKTLIEIIILFKNLAIIIFFNNIYHKLNCFHLEKNHPTHQRFLRGEGLSLVMEYWTMHKMIGGLKDVLVYCKFLQEMLYNPNQVFYLQIWRGMEAFGSFPCIIMMYIWLIHFQVIHDSK